MHTIVENKLKKRQDMENCRGNSDGRFSVARLRLPASCLEEQSFRDTGANAESHVRMRAGRTEFIKIYDT